MRFHANYTHTHTHIYIYIYIYIYFIFIFIFILYLYTNTAQKAVFQDMDFLYKVIIFCNKNKLESINCQHYHYNSLKSFTYPRVRLLSYAFESIFPEHWHNGNIQCQDYYIIYS